jgi:transposase-like protein
MKKATERTKDASQGAGMQAMLPILGVLATVKNGLYDVVIGAGLRVLEALLEQERIELCGPRYRHNREREVVRWGYDEHAELVLGGRRVGVKRPRARSKSGKEVPLPSWEQFSAEDPLLTRAVEQMLVGVATRKYKRSLEPLPAGVSERGTSKSAVSRRFVEATEAQLEKWLAEPLGDFAIAVLMLDGIVCGAHTVLVALGIDEQGYKRVLGVCEGATENAAACTALLSNLVDRGLRTDRSILVVIDGSKALAKSVRDVFGNRALIQRCQVHKKRNVLARLPDAMRDEIGTLISTAYRSSDPQRAMRLLKNIARRLERAHPGAAAALREGLEETLTVVAFQLPEALARTLSTTNPIENLNGRIRDVSSNVKRWQGGTMVLRWVAASLGEAAKGFRRLKGYQGMPKLLAALRAHDARIGISLATVQKAA